MVLQVLMVAEKPSLAKSLGEILSHKRCDRRKSICNACDVYEFTGTFPAGSDAYRYGNKGVEAHFKMTSVCGHVMGLDFLPKYNNWDNVDPIDLFDAETEKKESSPNLRICDFLKSEGRGIDYLVLWLDCDKEGENICFEVIREVQPYMRKTDMSRQTIFRARFSSITETAIVKALQNLTHPNENESRSVDARMELDLRIGCAFTRFQTRCFQSKYTGLNNSVISYGPCQTPTLGFCVQRYDDIQQFKPEKYWKLDLKVKHRSSTLALDWARGGIFDNEVVHLFLALVQGQTEVQVVSVTEKLKTKAPPPALHTVELLRMASSKLHIGPKQTMEMAERLYIAGFISYPRTETTRYPKDFDFYNILSSLKGHQEFGEVSSSLLQSGYNVPRTGTDAGDHPPITPMRSATRDLVRDSDWRLYDFITRHFLATLLPECKYKQTEAILMLGEEKFHWSGSTLVSPGYIAIYSWHTLQNDDTLGAVQFEMGQIWEVEQLKVSEHLTSAPGYLSESELISLMEKHRIGTDASISVHIENICSRNYVKVDSGRKLIPTKLGIVLVHGYQKIDPQLVLPTMRSAIEEQLNLVAKGKVHYDEVLNHTLAIFRSKFEYFREHISAMDELFEASFSTVAESGRPLSKCGKCRHYMKFIASRPQRLYCMHCEVTYGLPLLGNIKLYKELKCPLDDFELLLFIANNGRKSYLLCPYCYNEPPFKKISKGMTCSLCPHSACPQSRSHHRVDKCTECENGILVLEPHWQTAGPAPKWKISCNSSSCSECFVGFAGSSDVSCTEDLCTFCGACLLSVDLTKVSGLPEGVAADKRRVGCFRCDSGLSELIGYFDRREDGPRHGGRRKRGGGKKRGRRH